MGYRASSRSEANGAIETKHQFYHDMDGEGSLSTTIVSALLELEGEDVTSLDFVLHDYVDTDALDSIFAPKLDGTSRKDIQIEIALPGYSVTVDSDGHIVVTELDSEPSL